MRVLVVGATGQTGRRAVRQLLAREHEVTAFARDPSKVLEKSPLLKVSEGHARDPESLKRAVASQDAVLVAFGPRSFKKLDVQETLMKNLIEAMTVHGVKRLVNLSAWGAGDSTPFQTPLYKYFFVPLLLRHLFADKARADALLQASDLEYVNVRPGLLNNGAARGGVRASLDGKGLKASMSREDLAAFMIEQLTSDEWVRKSPLIGY